ncbi:MAG: NAD-dependent epimerase/dehydratase family protein [candidate division WS1 bacterium]|jgi:CDP-paratose 2-epimerase|nr:NAD-dependent epimerase/dehydratase family protein [candidate division WS1 bacterium]
MSAQAQEPELGILEWFRLGEEDRVEQVLADLRALNIKRLRSGISWADWHRPEGRDWYDWLIPRLISEVELLPCLNYTPPSLGITPKTSSPPRESFRYGEWVGQILQIYGDKLHAVELWNEPNNLSDWDWTVDPGWVIFGEMVGWAAWVAKGYGATTVLAGMSPPDANWLRMMAERGVLEHIDVVGLHGFPGTWELRWESWETYVERTQEVLDEFAPEAEIWITEVGFSTWRHDEHRQMRVFADAMAAPVERVYWYAAEDLNSEASTTDGFHSDEREYHFGLKAQDGTSKQLYRALIEGGPERVRELLKLCRDGRRCADAPDRVLITGGCGFVGTNLADHFLSEGRAVTVLDNLSRPGVEQNLRWLQEQHGDLLQVDVADVRDELAIRRCVGNASAVFHLAGQVAVTTSVDLPMQDFEINAQGTLNLLEELRRLDDPPPLVFTSTNKVYGGLSDVRLERVDSRYQPVDRRQRRLGVSEDRPLDFHSPYGCSKGAADAYVTDYARTYGMPATVFRMSCIYGPHQMGTEDQGWVAHFLISALNGRPITIFGDGLQVRDILFVDDLVDALVAASESTALTAGEAYNIGGGPDNAVSLLNVVSKIEALTGITPDISFAPWRVGDQRYYVSDTTKFSQVCSWKPGVSVDEGLEALHDWLLAEGCVPEGDRVMA